MPALAARVVDWQRHHGRHDLPWQGTRDPYRVWLSEVMLQQTQVATVTGYYGRFLARFPTVQALAAASLDDVLALWSGLGYYSRARHLHRAAQAVVAQHGGRFPAASAALAELPGIGRSTAAAIAAFCFGERVAILDGNVRRVLARTLGFDGDLARPAEVERLWRQAEALLPADGIEAYTQGLMDLGATVCLRTRPQCPRCPLRDDCVAHRLGRPEAFPVKARRAVRGTREHALLWLHHRGRWWLVQRPDTGVWARLWSLPEHADATTLGTLTAGWPGHGEEMPPVRHALTHFDWTLHPLRWFWPDRRAVPAAVLTAASGGADGRWFAPDEALALGLATPVRRLLAAFGAADDLFAAAAPPVGEG